MNRTQIWQYCRQDPVNQYYKYKKRIPSTLTLLVALATKKSIVCMIIGVHVTKKHFNS